MCAGLHTVLDLLAVQVGVQRVLPPLKLLEYLTLKTWLKEILP